MSVVIEKLNGIGGKGPLKERDWRIRSRLGWHNKSTSAVRHLIYGERRPSLEEVRQIEAAHLKHCVQKAADNDAENRRLFETMRQSIVAMEQSDPEFFAPHIAEVGKLLVQLGYLPAQTGSQD